MNDNKTIQLFEESAQEYDAWFEKHPFIYASELQALNRFISPGGIGLEIGVGTGRFAAPLGLQVGVEPARAMAEKARQRGLRVVRAVAEELPFLGASFNLALLVTTLCFLPAPFLALGEVARVLKPGGRIIIGMIDQDSSLGRAYETRKRDSKFYRGAHFHTVSQVLEWLAQLPFRDLQTCQTLFRDLGEITALEPVKIGHGEGGFAVIAAQRGL